jgi:hypothetical protein
MKFSDDSSELLAELLNGRDFGERVKGMLRSAMDEKRLGQVIQDMIDLEPRGENQEARIENVMVTLQSLADVERVPALVLMANLYESAGDLYMHDICNSIDIWIYKNHTPELGARLKLNTPPFSDDAMKRHYNEWIAG